MEREREPARKFEGGLNTLGPVARCVFGYADGIVRVKLAKNWER